MELILPEYAKYIYEINFLRMKAAEKICYLDALKYHICRYLSIDYMLKIGALEYKLAIAETKVEKANFQLGLYKQNIEEDKFAGLEEEMFKERDKKIALLGEAVNTAINASYEKIVSEEDIVELNTHYLILVKDYSPKINLKNTEEDNELFCKIQKAYINGNVKEVKKYEKCKKDGLFFDELEAFKTEKIRLEELIRSIENETSEIKNSFPYNEKTELQDENLFRRRKENINAKIAEKEKELNEVEKELKKFKK